MDESLPAFDRRSFLRRLGALAFAAPLVASFALDSAGADTTEDGAYCGNQLGVILGNQAFTRMHFNGQSGIGSAKVKFNGVIEDVVDGDVEHQLLGSFVINGPAGTIEACGVRGVSLQSGGPGLYDVRITAESTAGRNVLLVLSIANGIPSITHASDGVTTYNAAPSTRGLFQLS